MAPFSNQPAPSGSCLLAAAIERFRALHTKSTPSPADYPPISSIPRTKDDRLDRATPKPSLDEPIPSSSPLAAPFLLDNTPSSPPTVLYLAYGSNLCAKTFLGTRGIRPLSAVNVSAPSLRLTFDLPGIAYKEPCFANTAPRKIPKQPPKLPPGLPDPPKIPPGFSYPPPVNSGKRPTSGPDYDGLEWDGGLIGVVYEVTADDYATIVRTEGGGASYQDILVPCIPLPTRLPGIPENPGYPELPKPFLAHTLYAPRIPKKPEDGNGDGQYDDDGDGDDGDDNDKNPLDRLKNWWHHLLLQPMRPDPEYAQPSARYLQLIMDGAAEHGLPLAYQRYLASLQPYTITSRLQAIGQFLFLSIAVPIMLLSITLGKVLAGEDGRVPVWFALAMDTTFHLMWLVYDRFFKPVFGDGERTVDGAGQIFRIRGRRASILGGRRQGHDVEKLLSEA